MRYQVTRMSVSSIKTTLKFIKSASDAACDDTNLTADLKARVQADFQKRYTSEAAQTILNMTTWLDPRYKTEYLTEDGGKNASENIKEQMMAIDLASNALSNTADSTDDATDNQPPPAKKKKSLTKLLGELKKSSETAPATPATRLAQIELEMSWYLKVPIS